MIDLTIRNASELSPQELTDAFNAAYEEYVTPLQLSAEQMQHHIHANSIDLSASVVAQSDGTDVGIGLLGHRGSVGWVGGVGVIPARRGQGIGRALMNALTDSARRREMSAILLEVLTNNEKAYQLYQSLGFETLRRLLILGCDSWRNPLDTSAVEIRSISLDEALSSPFANGSRNPWQRQPESLRVGQYDVWGAFENGQIRATAIAAVSSRRVQFADLAGDSELMRALVAYVHQLQPEAGGVLVNLGEDDPAWSVLAALGYEERLSQYEMRLDLAHKVR